MNIIHDGSKIGTNPQIGNFVIIGEMSKGQSLEPTVIGDNATIRSHTIIYAGNKIGDNFQTGHGAQLRESNIIGNNVSIGSKSVVEHHVKIEDNVRVHTNVFIPEYTVLEEGCWIGPCVTLTNAKYPHRADTKSNLKGVVVKKHAIIGANATILPGVVIGEKAIVGAGSVVTSNVAAGKVVVGNPAKAIKDRKELGYTD